MLRDVCAGAGVRVEIAGSPDPGRSAATAEVFAADARDDLRATIASADVDIIIIADPGAFGLSGEGDAEAVLHAAQRGVRIVSLEPVPASGDAARSGAWLPRAGGVAAAEVVRHMPGAMTGPGFVESAELRRMLGEPRAATISCGGTPEHSSAGARLRSALTMLVGTLGVPESIDAAFIPPPGDRREPRTLRDLDGTITALARYADGRAATLIASNQWGAWSRGMELLLGDGRISVRPEAFTWCDAAGRCRDEHRGRGPASWADELTAQLTAFLDPAATQPPPIEVVAVLACVDAVLLSARNGQAVAVETVRRGLEG